MDLSIAIVNYNTKEFLKGCLESIYDTVKSIEFEIYVVDNASIDGSAQMVEDAFPGVKLIKNKENLGFAKANNQAIEISKGRHILLLNPDIVSHPKAMESMVEFLDKNSKIGAIGAKLLNPDGSVQISGYYCKFPSFFQVLFFYTALRHLALKSSFLKYRFWQHVDVDKPCEVDQPPGACLMVKKVVIDQIGLLDEDFPLFFNDVDWCYRIKRAGWKIFYYPNAEMIHFGGRSFVSQEINDKIKWGLASYNGLEKYFVKYNCHITAITTKLIVLIDSAIKFPAWGILYILSKSKREKAKRVFQYNAAIIKHWCLKA